MFAYLSYVTCVVVCFPSVIMGDDKFTRLLAPYNMPPVDQYHLRCGFYSGIIGTLEAAVALPPVRKESPVVTVHWYKQPEGFTCNSAVPSEEKPLQSTISQLLAFHKGKDTLIGMKMQATDKEMFEPYIVDTPTGRKEFVLFYCPLRKKIFPARNESRIVPDYYTLCPNACGNRYGVGEASLLQVPSERYAQPCTYPKHEMIPKSAVCQHDPESTHGLLESFSCDCPKGMVFDDTLKLCTEIKKNAKNASLGYTIADYFMTPCSRYGTDFFRTAFTDRSVIEDRLRVSSHQTVRCVCMTDHYGTYCEKKKDPCTMPVGGHVPGNIACLVGFGNKCIPDREYARYTCKCTRGFEKIENINHTAFDKLPDNCFKQSDPCSVKGCVHGSCVLTDRGSAMQIEKTAKGEPLLWMGQQSQLVARCLCDRGWTGARCSLPVLTNAWSPWSSWSRCEPACLESFTQRPPAADIFTDELMWGTRQRLRHRVCAGKQADCNAQLVSGKVELRLTEKGEASWKQYQNRPCRPRPCDRYLRLAMKATDAKSSYILNQAKEILRQSHTVHLWIIAMLTIVSAVFGFAAAFATKLHSDKVYKQQAKVKLAS